jgi:hypothetical protein
MCGRVGGAGLEGYEAFLTNEVRYIGTYVIAKRAGHACHGPGHSLLSRHFHFPSPAVLHTPELEHYVGSSRRQQQELQDFKGGKP